MDNETEKTQVHKDHHRFSEEVKTDVGDKNVRLEQQGYPYRNVIKEEIDIQEEEMEDEEEQEEVEDGDDEEEKEIDIPPSGSWGNNIFAIVGIAHPEFSIDFKNVNEEEVLVTPDISDDNVSLENQVEYPCKNFIKQEIDIKEEVENNISEEEEISSENQNFSTEMSKSDTEREDLYKHRKSDELFLKPSDSEYTAQTFTFSDYQYQCKGCNKMYSCSSSFKVFVRTDAGIVPFKCGDCYEPVNPKDYSPKHYECSVCNRSFSRAYALKVHSITHSSEKDTKRFECSICNRSFFRAHALKVHSIIHMGQKPYKCKECDEEFIQLSVLKRHTQLKHEKKEKHLFECAHCDKKYVRLKYLTRHSNTHHFNLPNEKLQTK